MLLALGRILLQALAALSILLAVLWVRSYRHADLIRLDWDYVTPQSVALISRNGAIHLDHTTLRPLNALRRATEWRWSFHNDAHLPPELSASTTDPRFASLAGYQIRTPMQDLYEDVQKSRPIFMTATVPMKLISVPFWFVLPIVAAAPIAGLIWRIRHRQEPVKRRGSRILWFLRCPALLAAIATLLLSLAWLRSGWRTDDLRFALTRERCCMLRVYAGQIQLEPAISRGYYERPRPEYGLCSWTIDQNRGGLANDWIVAPIEVLAGNLRIPIWLIGMLTASIAATSFLHRRMSPTFVPGHCRNCGYDLRASSGRCPECGIVISNDAPPRSVSTFRARAALWFALILAMLASVLLVGWIRSRDHEVSFLHIVNNRMTGLTIENGRIEGHSVWTSTNGGDIHFASLPALLPPIVCAIASVVCFAIARPKRRVRGEAIP